MSDPKKKQKIKKGDYGYFKAEKKKQLFITFVLFAVPLGIFSVRGYIISQDLLYGQLSVLWAACRHVKHL